MASQKTGKINWGMPYTKMKKGFWYYVMDIMTRKRVLWMSLKWNFVEFKGGESGEKIQKYNRI